VCVSPLTKSASLWPVGCWLSSISMAWHRVTCWSQPTCYHLPPKVTLVCISSIYVPLSVDCTAVWPCSTGCLCHMLQYISSRVGYCFSKISDLAHKTVQLFSPHQRNDDNCHLMWSLWITGICVVHLAISATLNWVHDHLIFDYLAYSCTVISALSRSSVQLLLPVMERV